MSSLLKLFNLLDYSQRRKLLFLQFLVFFMSCMEVISVLAIGPFMALLGNMESIYAPGIINSHVSSIDLFSQLIPFLLITSWFFIVNSNAFDGKLVYLLIKLSSLSNVFHEEFTAKQAMHYDLPRMTKFLSDELNDRLESAIRDAGDHFEGRNTSASCLMTRWDMHDYYDSFAELSEAAITVAESGALAVRTHSDGTNNPIKLYQQESWGLIYNKGHSCKAHTHWPSVWSYTYCVKACPECAPFQMENATGGAYEIAPRTGQ